MSTNSEKRLIKDKHGNIFQLNDVPGDGNCLFHSFVKSPSIPYSNHKEFRSVLVMHVETIIRNQDDHKDLLILFHILFDDSVVVWLETMKDNNSWGDNLVALFVAQWYQVNVVIMTNALNGFIYFDVKQLCKMYGLNIIHRKDEETVYIYHFTYLQPYTPTITCNHFGALKLLPPKIRHISPLYTGGPITDVNDSMSIVNKSKLYSAIDSSQYVDKYKIPPKKKFQIRKNLRMKQS